MNQVSKPILEHLLKSLLPSPVIRVGRRVRQVYRNIPAPRETSRLTHYLGSAPSVLQCRIAYNANGGYCVPHSSYHRPAAQAILAGEVWEAETLRLITSSCESGDVVHAGTYFGDFIPALSRACTAGAKVWGFEPNPENFRCAVITRHINGLGNVELFEAGLGEREGRASLVTVGPKGKALGGASRVQEADTGDTPIRLTSVDEAVPANRSVSIIHLDVEGYEKSALAGAQFTIQRCRPLIVVEILPQGRWLAENILPMGYRIEGKVDGNTILRHL
jgi:FkbM family methyltransferase